MSWRRLLKLSGLLVGLCSLSATPFEAEAGPEPSEQPAWGSLDAFKEDHAIFERVDDAVSRRDFASLDRMEIEFRPDTAMTLMREPTLKRFYSTIVYELDRANAPGECGSKWESALSGWQAVAPRSPALAIVRAELLDQEAWCYRGHGHVGDVADGAWKPFHDLIAQAISALEGKRALARDDPEYYAELANLYLADGRPREKFQLIVDEATSRFPYYYPTYDTDVNYYQPQWYGGPGDIDAVARYAVERTKARDGLSAYFRVYWHLVACRCYGDVALADWRTMKVAMADMASRYPGDWTLVRLARLSCVRGEADEARKYLAKMTVNDLTAWPGRSWQQCRELVESSGAPVPASPPAS